MSIYFMTSFSWAHAQYHAIDMLMNYNNFLPFSWLLTLKEVIQHLLLLSFILPCTLQDKQSSGYAFNAAQTHKEELLIPHLYQQSGTNKTCYKVGYFHPSEQAKHLYHAMVKERISFPFFSLSLSSDRSWIISGKVFTTDRQWSSITKIATRARFSPTLGARASQCLVSVVAEVFST